MSMDAMKDKTKNARMHTVINRTHTTATSIRSYRDLYRWNMHVIVRRYIIYKLCTHVYRIHKLLVEMTSGTET
jgi:hypothetical protein